MIAKEVTRTTLQKTEPVLNMFRDLIEEQAHFFIFPFALQGCINITETGLKPEALDISDYTYFSKVISEDHPLVATWEDSTFWIGSPKRYKHMQNEMGAMKKYVVGKYLKGAIEEETTGLMINKNESFGADMTNLQQEERISLLSTTRLEKEDIFKLYVVKRFDTLDNYVQTPDTEIKGLWDRNQIQWLYVSQASNFYSLFSIPFLSPFFISLFYLI